MIHEKGDEDDGQMGLPRGGLPCGFITRKVFFYGLLSMIPYYLLRPGFPPMATIFQPDIPRC